MLISKKHPTPSENEIPADGAKKEDFLLSQLDRAHAILPPCPGRIDCSNFCNCYAADAVLPPERKSRLEDDAIIVALGWEMQHVRRSLRQERKPAICYREEKGARTERMISPLVLGFFESARVLAGSCELPGASVTSAPIDSRGPRARGPT